MHQTEPTRSLLGAPAEPFWHSARELKTAREVQSRLLPQRLPGLDTLEYAVCYVPARGLGGDYYDFLGKRSGRLGIALGDISGKGISAALMMASLQGSLRSHYAAATNEMGPTLESVNDLFYESTASQHFASLVLADYDDGLRRLRYANCGHLPPLLLRRDGTVERLAPTTTVLGAFEEWSCAVEETDVAAQDLVALYTDGISETTNHRGEEYGEDRLLDSLEIHRHLPLPAMIEAVLQSVRRFGRNRRRDDMTLLIARGME
jgi:serine phosphatase RsbU (regulator of sigma subunit)